MGLFGMIGGIASAAINAGSQGIQNKKNRQHDKDIFTLSERANRDAMDRQAQLNYNLWAKTQSYDALRQRAQQAGFNPALAITGGQTTGASGVGALSTSGTSNAGQAPQFDLGAIMQMAETELLKAQERNIEEDTRGKQIINNINEEYGEEEKSTNIANIKSQTDLNNANKDFVKAQEDLTKAQTWTEFHKAINTMADTGLKIATANNQQKQAEYWKDYKENVVPALANYYNENAKLAGENAKGRQANNEVDIWAIEYDEESGIFVWRETGEKGTIEKAEFEASKAVDWLKYTIGKGQLLTEQIETLIDGGLGIFEAIGKATNAEWTHKVVEALKDTKETIKREGRKLGRKINNANKRGGKK